MNWWLEHKFRMVQNNLRDIDALMDADKEVAYLKKIHANVVQLGCGGITAFSETEHPSQKRSPWLKNDKFGELLEKCHENGIRVIARFDASKVDRSFEKRHPEWLLRNGEGRPVYYNDTVVTCLNSDYQQKEIPSILQEILKKYPVDGVFFNMFGYQERDYDGNYIGPCQCGSCKKRFREMFDEELPKAGEQTGGRWQKYQAFRQITVDDILDKIRRTVKEIRPEAALSTYFDEHVDIIRCETNTAVDRPLPFWIYSASDNVSCIENTFRDKVSSNVGINAVDIPYRFTGVSDTFNRIRLYQNIANRGNLDWCIIGAFPNYPDRSNYRGTAEVFAFHERYQDLYDTARSMARVLLVSPGKPYGSPVSREYRGIFRMLKEAHVLFDTLIDTDSSAYGIDPASYDLVIIPGIKKLQSGMLREIFLNAGQRFLGTAGSFSEDPELLKKCFGIDGLKEKEAVRGAYFMTEPKEVFRSFPYQDWVYLDRKRWEAEGILTGETAGEKFGEKAGETAGEKFGEKAGETAGEKIGEKAGETAGEKIRETAGETAGVKTGENAGDEQGDSAAPQGILPYITPAPYGPPERCYGHRKTEIPGAVLGENSAAVLFEAGALYDLQGYECFKNIVLDLVNRLLPKTVQAPYETDAHPQTEIFLNRIGARTGMMELLNLTGFEGVTVLPPVVQREITVKFHQGVEKVMEMGPDGTKPVPVKDNSFTIPELALHKAYLIRYSENL